MQKKKITNLATSSEFRPSAEVPNPLLRSGTSALAFPFLVCAAPLAPPVGADQAQPAAELLLAGEQLSRTTQREGGTWRRPDGTFNVIRLQYVHATFLL